MEKFLVESIDNNKVNVRKERNEHSNGNDRFGERASVAHDFDKSTGAYNAFAGGEAKRN